MILFVPQEDIIADAAEQRVIACRADERVHARPFIFPH